MKALTVRQPWAWLIIHGYKTAEYRSWRTSYRGPLAILAGLALDEAGIDEAGLLGITLPDEVDTGGVIGYVELTDITGQPGDYTWHLRNPQPSPFRPMRGGLGILTIPD